MRKRFPRSFACWYPPLLTTLVGALLLFTAVGPLGRGLASVITGGLVWMTQNLGVFGYALFSGLQQLVVITGLHHIFGAIEAQLLADTGRNILNPLMSVAMTAQGGAVLGYLMKNRKDAKTQELCIPSFISVLFGITEPALFGVNVRFKYPLIGGCIGGAIGGAMVYFTNLAALGFGTTVIPGIALADPANNGYVNYVISHGVALAAGFALTLVLGGFYKKAGKAFAGAGIEPKAEKIPSEEGTAAEVYHAYASGELIAMEDVQDATFAQKILGDGVAIIPSEGGVYAPIDGEVLSIFETKHAVCLTTKGGKEILLHIGIDTVNLKGRYFTAHVKDGDSVKAGQLLVSFDLEKTKAEGYDMVIPMIFTDPENRPDMSGWSLRNVQHGEAL